MKHLVTDRDHIFGPWLARQTDGEWVPGQGKTIGLIDDEANIFAATMFSAWNGASVMMHCAAEGKNWLNREFLWFNFHYAFNQLRVQKIISPVETVNYSCIRFIEHLGFTAEAVLSDAAPQGDLILYTLTPAACRWHKAHWRTRTREQAQGTRNT